MIRSGVIRSGSGVIRSRLGMRDGSGSVFGFASVCNISDVSTVSVIYTVGHGLDTAVRKSHMVLSGGSITITVLIGTELGAGVVISYGVSVVVSSGGFCVSRGGAVGGGTGGGSHGGSSHKGKNSNERLKDLDGN